MLQNIIHFPDQSTHAYLIPTIDEIVCFCNYEAIINQNITKNDSEIIFFFWKSQNILKIKDNRNSYNRYTFSIIAFFIEYNAIKSVVYQIPVGGPGFG